MQRRRSSFEIYLRTGRRIAEAPNLLETKFNPWHDPEDGRFTFAHQGRQFGGGGSGVATQPVRKPAASGTAGRVGNSPLRKPSGPAAPKWPKHSPVAPRPAPAEDSRQPGPNQNSRKTIMNIPAALQRTGQELPAAKPSLRPIPFYPETGSSNWRAANDQVFIEAADKFNRERGFKPGHPEYIDPLLLKAWAMVESGGSKSAFLRDPLQVNNPGDYDNPKPKIIGLAKGQRMTPAISVEAALKWLEFRGHPRDTRGRPGAWIGIEGAIRKYNARNDLHPSGLPHSVWYSKEVLKLYGQAKKGP